MDAEKDYDRIPEEKREQYFKIEFQRRFGIQVSEAEELLEDKASTNKPQSLLKDDVFEFPSSKVKNWDSLRKHVAEVLCYANPVKYDYAVRRIRVSKPVSEVQAYLKNMYKIDGRYKYACQMCHEAFANVEMCQIANNPDLELDSMNLCLCPNCAREYKKMRADAGNIKCFVDDIANFKDNEINASDPVRVEFDREEIWFTQSHIAEIRELIALQKEVEKAGTDVYKAYVGKRIYHKSYKSHGLVIGCDGSYIKIQFEDGGKAGQNAEFSLETCLKNSLIQLTRR